MSTVTQHTPELPTWLPRATNNSPLSPRADAKPDAVKFKGNPASDPWSGGMKPSKVEYCSIRQLSHRYEMEAVLQYSSWGCPQGAVTIIAANVKLRSQCG